MKKYVIVAGVNGAGKSTLYNSILADFNYKKINLDDLTRKIGDWNNISNVIKAGIITVRSIEECLHESRSFCQETTLCGKTIFKTIARAKEMAYSIELHYIGVDDVSIAKERVRNRVLNGGHGVAEEDIERRYVESMNNFLKVLPMCDIAAVYDNTDRFRRFAIYKKGNCMRLSGNVPKWYERIEKDTKH